MTPIRVLVLRLSPDDPRSLGDRRDELTGLPRHLQGCGYYRLDACDCREREAS